ncbi:MAG: TetR/AcrR family transcriptional regulator [Alphaproteobacteria bacterium]|nr:TetR/AcrR family transcriptional regulator [Alphaproteobacteria bacterium]MCB9694001.1 TetR/AcrR family transcriptional regulator [Alphaproteobacteria bacterium]
MAETPELRWIRAPLQERSERTLDAILDAAERMLEKGPIQNASVAAIAREAGSSVGAFYHRFPDKQALTRTLYERFRNESLATIEGNFGPERWRGHTLREVLTALVDFTARDYLARPGLRRFAMHLIESDPDVRALAQDLSSATVSALARLLERRREELAHPDPALAAEFLHRVLFATLDQIAMFHGEPPTGKELSEDELIGELTRAITAYLGVS